MLQFLAPLISPIVGKLVDRIPDPNERARAKEEAEGAIIAAANQAMLAQTRINEVEAGHKSLFVAGWRPFIGWVCGSGLAYHFIARDAFAYVVMVISWFTGADLADFPEPPELDVGTLYQLVTGLLGLGTLRTVEKIKGVATSTWNRKAES